MTIFQEKVLSALGMTGITVAMLYEEYDEESCFSDEESLQEEENLEEKIEEDTLSEVLVMHKKSLEQLEEAREKMTDSNQLLYMSLDDIKLKNSKKRGNTEKSGDFVEVDGADGFVYFSADKRLRRSDVVETLKQVYTY